MLLSDDGKTLLRVTNDDLENGGFKFPDSVTHIGSRAFKNCTSLTQMTIPNSVKYIGEEAFWGCAHLTQLTIPNSVTHIGKRAFYNCARLTQMTIPNSVTYIGEGAFLLCTGLTQMTIPNSVTHIGDGAFQHCYRLTQMTIPNSVKYIGEEAFFNCARLTQLTIPDSVTHIGIRAFKYCFCLRQVTIPNSVKYIGQYPFRYCPNFEVIAIDDRNQGDYQRILTLLPPEQQSLAKPWSDLKEVKKIKQVALKSVAALNMNGLTAHLLFKLLTTPDGNIGGKIYKYSVNTKSFFQRLNHARQPALAKIYGYPYPDFKSSTSLPEYAKQMLPRLCAKGAIQLNPTVAQITMPNSPQEANGYFEQIVKSKVQPTKSLSLWAYIWKCICDFFNWIIEKFSSVTNHPIKAQALA